MAKTLDKQLRVRVDAEEKAHVDTAQSEGGYPTLSHYMRAVLFDANVVIVGGAGFILIPAWTADDAQREQAMTQLQAVVKASEQLAQVDDAARVAEQAVPGQDFAPPPAEEIDPLGVADVDPDPNPPAGADFLGQESAEQFLERRRAELRQAGRSQLLANFEAEAELRQAQEAALAPVAPDLPPTTPPVPEPAPPPERQPGDRPRPDRDGPLPDADSGHGGCPVCGAAASGTGFCSQCGTAY